MGYEPESVRDKLEGRIIEWFRKKNFADLDNCTYKISNSHGFEKGQSEVVILSIYYPINEKDKSGLLLPMNSKNIDEIRTVLSELNIPESDYIDKISPRPSNVSVSRK